MSLLGLPNELLISMFQHLSLTERHRSLPLVSRRCWQLVCSPQLLHTVQVRILGPQAMRSLRSLARFLLEHGAGSVRRLQLDLGDGLPDHHQEVLLLLAAAATACSGLLELDITCGLAITLSAWLLPLASSLRRLRTGDFTSTVVAADSLEFMTALEDLEMGPISDFVDIEADARLPTTLTRLALGNGEGTATLPPQVAALPQLRLLHLRHPYSDAASYDALTRLSLHTLELGGCVSVVPGCLSALTTLRSLAVKGMELGGEEEEAVAAGLAAAMPHLTQLTQLAAAVESSAPLGALTALSGLRWLMWPCMPGNASAALPPGTWLAELQTLAAPLSLVARSLPALAAAQRLEQLCVYMPHEQDAAGQPKLRAILSWAVQQPSLQRLLLGDQPLPGTSWADVASAARLRPSLRIEPDTLTHPALV